MIQRTGIIVYVFAILLLFTVTFSGCGNAAVVLLLSNEKLISSFNFPSDWSGLPDDEIGDIKKETIYVTVPFDTNRSLLTPEIVHSGVSITPPGNQLQDFSVPVKYTVTAENGTTRVYTVNVTIALNSFKDIESFEFLKSENGALSTNVFGTVNESTIDLLVPSGTIITNLKPYIKLTESSIGALISPADGEIKDFSSAVTYTVTAADGSTKEYTVTVTIAPSDSKDITNFRFLSAENTELSKTADGTIVGTNITVIVPNGTVISALNPDIAITGASVSPADGANVNFSLGPVPFTVTAADTSTKIYSVTVDNTQSNLKYITTFRFLSAENNPELSNDVNGTIVGTNISVIVPNGTVITHFAPDIAITGASVSPADGADVNFLGGPVTYTVTAADTTTQDYTVTVDNTQSGDKDILTFNLLTADNGALAADIAGLVDKVAKTVYVYVPNGTVVSALEPDITINGLSISPADETILDFSDSGGVETFTVTADDLTTSVYTVTVIVRTPNLVLNGSFENGVGGVPDNWTKPNIYFSRSTDESSIGIYSLRYQHTAKTASSNQVVTILPDTDYIVSVSIMMVPGTTGSAVFDTWGRFDGTAQIVVYPGDAGRWIHFTGIFNSGAYTDVTLRCFGEGLFNGTIYFDNVMLTEVP